MRIRSLVLLLVLGLFAVLGFTRCGTTLRADDVEPDDGAYAEILGRYVDADGRVDYAGLATARRRLHSAYASIALIDPAELPDRDAELAFWIDAYNLAVLVGVDAHRPIDSVRDVSSPVPFVPKGAGFFYFTRFVIGGETMSLYHLEHEILRKRYDEPRIHFAINCASAGCPNLEAVPWRGGDLDRRLEKATRRFIADPGQVRVHPASRRIEISPIFKWFREDFGDLYGFLIRYSDGARAEALRTARDEGFTIEFFEYDWSLNDQSARAP